MVTCTGECNYSPVNPANSHQGYCKTVGFCGNLSRIPTKSPQRPTKRWKFDQFLQNMAYSADDLKCCTTYWYLPPGQTGGGGGGVVVVLGRYGSEYGLGVGGVGGGGGGGLVGAVGNGWPCMKKCGLKKMHRILSFDWISLWYKCWRRSNPEVNISRQVSDR